MRFILQYWGLLLLAGAVVGLPAIIAPSFLLGIVAPEYSEGATALRVLGLYVIILGGGQMAAQYLIAVRRERSFALVTIAAGLLGIVLLMVLVPRWSATGASFAVLLSHGLGIAVLLGLVVRHAMAIGEDVSVEST